MYNYYDDFYSTTSDTNSDTLINIIIYYYYSTTSNTNNDILITATTPAIDHATNFMKFELLNFLLMTVASLVMSISGTTANSN